MKSNKFLCNKRAFSLVELSIVLVIIGVITAGVTQGTILVDKYRLAIARKLTENSPISSMNGVLLWLETTSQNSFSEAETENNSPITTWRDINPTSVAKYNAAASTSNRPFYQADCINNLPCLSFDGVDDYMEINNLTASLTSYTIFVVIKIDTENSSDWDYILETKFANSVVADGQISMYITPARNLQVTANYAGSGVLLGGAMDFSSTKSPYLIFTHEKTGVNFYNRINQIDKLTSTTGITLNAAKNITGFIVGADSALSEFLNGQIGEIIIFDRYLQVSQRNDIEEYLVKKWGIGN